MKVQETATYLEVRCRLDLTDTLGLSLSYLATVVLQAGKLFTVAG